MRRSLTILALMGALYLAGCADQQDAAPPLLPPPAPLPVPPTPEVKAPAPVVPPVPPPKPPIPRQPEKTVYVPDELLGLDQFAVVKLLGSPIDSRNEGAARVLTYRGKNCQLDVILFLDVKSGTERVLSYDQQPNAGKNAAACYAAIRGGR
ncbi:MAG TPA: hypothetical protein VKP60_11470 [Magnetospirillaceae bacterium]|nr:hypothetical protein [Magnetospirillaceae bacterium]